MAKYEYTAKQIRDALQGPESILSSPSPSKGSNNRTSLHPDLGRTPAKIRCRNRRNKRSIQDVTTRKVGGVTWLHRSKDGVSFGLL
jgi:hypothetical protein